MVDLAKICQDHGETYLKLLLFNNTASPTLIFVIWSAIGRIPLCTTLAFTGVTSQVIWITISLLIGVFFSTHLKDMSQNGFIFPKVPGVNKKIFELPPPSYKYLPNNFRTFWTTGRQDPNSQHPSHCGSTQCHHCHTQMMKIWQPSISVGNIPGGICNGKKTRLFSLEKG